MELVAELLEKAADFYPHLGGQNHIRITNCKYSLFIILLHKY